MCNDVLKRVVIPTKVEVFLTAGKKSFKKKC